MGCRWSERGIKEAGDNRGGREVGKFNRYPGEALARFTDGLAAGEEEESRIRPRCLALKTYG